MRGGENIHREIQLLKVLAGADRRNFVTFARYAEASGFYGKVDQPEQLDNRKQADCALYILVFMAAAVVVVAAIVMVRLMDFRVQRHRFSFHYETSANIKINVASQFYNEPEPGTTGYALRKRRDELKITSRQMSALTGISRPVLLKAELSLLYLNEKQLSQACAVLKIAPHSIIDSEYKFFYQGYGQAIEFLVSKIGINGLLSAMKIKRPALMNWKNGHTLPHFKKRRALISLYNKTINS